MVGHGYSTYSHPDYLRESANWRLYEQFLQAVRRRVGPYWHALPREVARCWRTRRRADAGTGASMNNRDRWQPVDWQLKGGKSGSEFSQLWA